MDHPNWLPDLIGLGEDGRGHLHHRQLVSPSEGGFGACGTTGEEAGAGDVPHFSSAVTESVRVSTETDETPGRVPDYPAIVELELQQDSFL